MYLIHGCNGYIISVHCYKSDSVASLYSEIMPQWVNSLTFHKTFSLGIRSIFYRQNLKNIVRPNFKTVCNTTYYLTKLHFKSRKCPLELNVLLIQYVTLLTLHDLTSYNAVVHTFWPVVSTICGPSVRKLVCVTFLVLEILKWLLDLQKIFAFLT